MRHFILLIIALFSLNSGLQAQKKLPLLESKNEIIQRAIAELDSAMQAPKGELYLFIQKYQIKGEYTMQLTLRDKGKVVSVFVADKNNADIPSQNRLKDRLMKFKFQFKMPKNKDYKLNYHFNL